MVAWRGDGGRPSFPLFESPFYESVVDQAGLSREEREAADRLRRDGHVVFDFPEPRLEDYAAAIRAVLEPRFDRAGFIAEGRNERFPDLWRKVPAVRALATNAGVLRLLGKVFGRPAFPSQTLNFLVGTEQHIHSDAVHFHSVPERFMCGVWLALEDTDADNGPLFHVPGSHRLPVYGNDILGQEFAASQTPYEPFWDALVEAHHLRRETFHARKGQALIWAANLLHGGMPQLDRSRTRLSQVTHYYFEDCAWFHPTHTDWVLGRIAHERPVNIITGRVQPSIYCGRELAPPPKLDVAANAAGLLPEGFDSVAYLAANPDVAAAGMNAAAHWLAHGRFESRRLK